MRAQPDHILYSQTGAFSSIVLDYLRDDPRLSAFYRHRPDLQGVQSAIAERRTKPTDRALLVEQLLKQYESMPDADRAIDQIRLLADEHTFTVCTAHQPNIFTGHLYFIFKILHAIRLSEELSRSIPGASFVPVYYMGSEDADLDELGEVNILGEHYQWRTKQRGAVGRMLVDQGLLDIVQAMEGRLSVEPHGAEVIAMVWRFYRLGISIEQATFELVHALFGRYGLIVFLPDRPAFKARFAGIMKWELQQQFSFPLVAETVSRFPEEYKIQAAGREINLFYLSDQLRERIISTDHGFRVANTEINFTREEIYRELQEHPERFSPNVILRPVFQEYLLPNVVFVGGGGELAYWLELKQVFDSSEVPFPVLVLRNSFMLVNASASSLLSKTGITVSALFKRTLDLQNELVRRHATLRLDLDEEKKALNKIYDSVSGVSGKLDPTLAQHTEALRTQALRKLVALEKKMMQAERKRSDAGLRQVTKLKQSLFPNGTLHERVDNILPYLSAHGFHLIDDLLSASLGLDQQFTVFYI